MKKRLNNFLEVAGLIIAIVAMLSVLMLLAFPVIMEAWLVQVLGLSLWAIRLTVAGVAGAVCFGLVRLTIAGLIGLEQLKQSKLQTEMEKAQIALTQAKANREKIVTVTTKAGETLYSNESLYQYLPSVMVVKPGHDLWTNQLSGNVIQGQQIYRQLPANDGVPLLEGEANPIRTGREAIRNMIINPQTGELTVNHLMIQGPSGAGKTHLTRWLLSVVISPETQAEIFLSDPKMDTEHPWPFENLVTGFDEVPGVVNGFVKNVMKGKKAKRVAGNQPAGRSILLLDEWDACVSQFGDDFLKPVSRVVKEGRSERCHVIGVGQVSLIGASGGNSSLFNGTARFILNREAFTFINNNQFPYRFDKEFTGKLKNQLMQLQASKVKRFALVMPPDGLGLPFVWHIPELELPTVNQLAKQPKSILDLPVMPESDQDSGNDDLAILEANQDKLRYRHNGQVVISSVCQALGIRPGGPDFYRAKELAKLWDKQNSSSSSK